MGKKRTMVYSKKLTTAKVVEVINGPNGPTRIYGSGRKCEECNTPLSQYNSTNKCALCRTNCRTK